VTIPLSDDTRIFTSVKRESAVDAVHDRLLTAIAVGAYSTGDALPAERDLAPMLEVSRATLRQAIERLVEQGLLESRRGRGGGTFVTGRSWREVEPDTVRRTLHEQLPALAELFDERRLVEGMIAAAAAERRTEEQAERLLELAAEFEQAGDDMSTARRLDDELHALVVGCAHNTRLVTLSRKLTAEATLGFASEPYTPEFYALAVPEHRALAEAVAAGDVEGAREIAREHFRITQMTMEAALGEE
jgi:GntR family transcriptional regulator, transcriptional repressor for pyruvate dehydrogenase complex